MTPEQLSQALAHVLNDLIVAGEVALPEPLTGDIRVERPKSKAHGDYATNVALQLAKKAGLNPRELATVIADRLAGVDGIATTEVAGPGFINVRVDASAQGTLAGAIIKAADSYGRSTENRGRSFNIEFISANPTGPLHLGHTRWAVVGDAIARVLEATDARVAREFYINDRGVQMDHFGASLMARANGRAVSEDGYRGEYIDQLARVIVEKDPSITELPEADQLTAFREAGYELQRGEHEAELAEFNTHFDVWFSERSLHRNDEVNAAFAKLADLGHLFEADGALWMRTTDFGDDKDRVLRKSNGELTYFASDTAYYVNKRERGFDPCIYLLGADHHGYVGRLKAMSACAGDDPDSQLEVLIGQLVKIVSNGQELKLSKRAGTIVSLRELIDLIGVDALRYSLARYPADTPLTLDIDEMTRKSSDNPVYYVQYAHARLSSILRNAAAIGLDIDPNGYDAAQLTQEREGELMRALAQFPAVVTRSAEFREPHRVARYLEEVASSFHKFYDDCQVLPRGDEPASDLHAARLVLVAATRQVVANGLQLLGVSAPERM